MLFDLCSFTKLAEGDLSLAGVTSAPIPVSSYREVVVYIISTTDGCKNAGVVVSPKIVDQFRPDAQTPFGETGQQQTSATPGGGLVHVDGVDMRLVLRPESSTLPTCIVHYVVASMQ